MIRISAVIYFCVLCASLTAAEADIRFAPAASWPEADALFHQDPRWLGADGAYSVDLGHERVLWLFGDSFIAIDAAHSRHASRMIRNSVGVQQGYDPSRARMAFAWNGTGAHPTSFFPEQDSIWFWPGAGIRLDASVLVFLMKVKKVTGGLGFEAFDWTAAMIDDVDLEPSRWRLTRLSTPPNSFHVIVGSAGVVQQGDYLYACGSDEASGRHDICLIRWSLARIRERDLSAPEWWDAENLRWTAQTDLQRRPAAIFSNAQTEFTIHFDSRTQQWVETQTRGFGAADIAGRTAPRLTGPWTALHPLFRPPEMSQPGVMIYAGKAHPELHGAGLILTYAVNASFQRVLDDSSIYYPRFVKLNQ